MELRYNRVGGPCGWTRKPCSRVKDSLLHLLPRWTEMAKDLGQVILKNKEETEEFAVQREEASSGESPRLWATW